MTTRYAIVTYEGFIVNPSNEDEIATVPTARNTVESEARALMYLAQIEEREDADTLNDWKALYGEDFYTIQAVNVED